MTSPPRPRLPIGMSDFRQLREPGILYVDKTDFITQVLAAPKAVVLVPRPRRFGKTVNLSTLRTFVEKTKEDASALFEGLSVWGSAEARAHFGRYPVISLTFKDIKARTTLAVPNKEVEYVYRTLFLSWLEQRLGSTQVDELLQAVVSGDVESCERLLGVLLQSLSLHDLAERRTSKAMGGKSLARSHRAAAADIVSDLDSEVVLTSEQVYHVFVVGLLLGLQPRYLVRSNRESGGGRYDVMVIPRTPGQPGVVLELKVRNRLKRETEKGAMAAALRQLRERDYAAELRASGADPIHEIGVVFDGKRAWVEAAPPAGAPARRPPAAKKKPARAPAKRSTKTAKPSARRPARRAAPRR